MIECESMLLLFSFSVMKLFTVFSLLLITFVGVNTHPQQIHLSPTENPDEMTIMWSTESNVNRTVVFYGLSNNSLTQKAEGTYQNLVNDDYYVDLCVIRFMWAGTKSQRVHKVTLKGLSQNTKYYYKVGSEENWSEVFNFTTLPKGNDWETKMIIFGDLGEGSPTTSWLIKEAKTRMWQAFFHNGDIAYCLESKGGKVGDNFLNEIQPIAAYYPYLVSVGNHESYGNFTNFKVRFDMPGEFDNMFYSYKIGKVLLIVFSTEVFYEGEDRNVVNSNQWRWLKSTLKNANKRENRKQQPWIIVAGHRPIYCSTTVSEACPDYKLQSEYEDLFFKYGVDIVFSGHEHDYERSYPIYQNNLCTPKEDNPYINPCAPIYIISGAAGNFRGQFIFLDFQPNYIAYRSRDVSYTRLTAYNSTDLYLEQVSVDKEGEVIDKVLIHKDHHGPYLSNYL
ncbi:acid phosphatase type 7-like [Centruroides sculpturatus]|uniref:acid phosphatase type 7-like n=1 Tax=Centruroides sculpturatus TaxID=218467 RepID=UPI000C6D607C|nr:acid phosphatase type 7-like [Centruroides sculpturatus]